MVNNTEKLEKKLIRELNFQEKTKYKLENLMEWSSAEIKLQKGEKLYKLPCGLYMAMK